MYLLLLLALMGKDSSVKESLTSALNFYRENRELFTMLLQTQPQTAQGTPKAEQPQGQEKSQPQAVGNESVLQDFLKKFAES